MIDGDKCEMFGGPHDGRVFPLKDAGSTNEQPPAALRVPRVVPISTVGQLDPNDTKPIPVIVYVYRLTGKSISTNHWCYQYEGEGMMN